MGGGESEVCGGGGFISAHVCRMPWEGEGGGGRAVLLTGCKNWNLPTRKIGQEYVAVKFEGEKGGGENMTEKLRQ